MTYTPEFLRLYLIQSDRLLSRTAATEEVDVSVSRRKQSMLVTGRELAAIRDRNRDLVADYIAWKARLTPKSSTEVLSTLLTIAELTGLSIFPAGIFREWPYDPSRYGLVCAPSEHCNPDHILDALKDLCDRIISGFFQPPKSPIEIPVSTEWEVGIGPIHPFYDACGRISRYFSLLLLLWYAERPRAHTSRLEYYKAGCAGRQAFVAYYKSLLLWKDG